jgi:Predicted transcriptional regulators
MRFSISETAKLSGISVRTLHYYDEIGLLHPTETTEAGYRFYDDQAITVLQQILFLKELDFPLKEIKTILSNPRYDKQKALADQKNLLTLKKQRLERLLHLLDQTMKGEDEMSLKEFDMAEIEEAKKKYASEAKERWGGTCAYEESEKRTASYKASDWAMIKKESDAILKRFAELRGSSADTKEVQNLVSDWQAHITKYFYPCTKQILEGLGEMYVCDERFTKNLDCFGEGTATLMNQAIQFYCKI